MRSADWVCRAAVVALAVCAQARPAIVVSNLGINDVDEYAKEFLPLSETAHFCADGIHPEGGACKVIAAETAKRIER